MAADQGRGITAGLRVELRERIGQVLDRAAQDARVVGVSQVGGQGGLSLKEGDAKLKSKE